MRPPSLPDSVFVHDAAIVETDEIGDGTRVWAFAHVKAGARLGADVNVCNFTYIEAGAVVGDRVTLKSGVYLWDGIHLEDDVFVGPNATFTNDRFPRSRVYHEQYETTRVKRGATIGAGAVILPGLTIGEEAMVAAGAVVTRDVPPRSVVVGNPGRVVRTLPTSSVTSAGTTAPGG